MRLLIISHTPHYLVDGVPAGWGATVREIDELARLFESVVHIAPLHPEAAPASAVPYQSPRVRLRAVSPAGGERLRDKLGIPFHYPWYARAFLQERRAADVIHVRCPANISLLAILLLGLFRDSKRRWIKYAGDWTRVNGEPATYRFQRWLLARNFPHSLVTVNGHSPGQGAHVHSFLNPCLLSAELAEGLEVSRNKKLCQPVRLVFVGKIDSAKGADICLEIAAQLQSAGIKAEFDLIGEGDDMPGYRRLAQDLGVTSSVTFHGGLPRAAVGQHYARAHFVVLPSDTEGWPKVLSEAMAYGAVPIASAVGSIAEYLARFATGQAIPSRDPQTYTEAIGTYLRNPARWEEHSQNAVRAARLFSYDCYLQAVCELLQMPDKIAPVSA